MSTKASSSSKHNENRMFSENVHCVMCGDSVYDISKHFQETHKVCKNLQVFLLIQEKLQPALRVDHNEDVGLGEVKPGSSGLGRPESLDSETLSFYSMDGEASSRSRSSEASSPKSLRNSITQESAQDRDTMSNRTETSTLAYQSPAEDMDKDKEPGLVRSLVSEMLSCSPLHHHAPGRLQGDAVRAVQEPPAGPQTQDEECGPDEGKLDIHNNGG